MSHGMLSGEASREASNGRHEAEALHSDNSQQTGTAQETTRDTAEILVADDDEAIRQAQEWLRRSGAARDGDFLLVVENGRGVRSIELRIP